MGELDRIIQAEMIEPSPEDNSETRAFIDGWNAKLAGEHDFDMALHWWKRERCGLNSADDLAQAVSPPPSERELIVAWLRKAAADEMNRKKSRIIEYADAMEATADAIERGAHLTQAAPPPGDDLERVARAMAKHFGHYPDKMLRSDEMECSEADFTPLWKQYESLAQAAIAALSHRPDTRVVEVLRPFAEVADDACFAQHPDSYAPRPSRGKPNLAHYRAARTLLSELEGK